MRIFKGKRWYFIVIVIIILAFSSFPISIYVKNSIKIQRQELEKIREAEEQATVSEVYVCTKDGISLPKQENTSLYVVPKDMERIYICGTLEISIPSIITIYLFKNDDAFTSAGAMLEKGPFIMDVISTAALKGGEYRADLYIVREKSAASVDFIVEK